MNVFKCGREKEVRSGMEDVRKKGDVQWSMVSSTPPPTRGEGAEIQSLEEPALDCKMALFIERKDGQRPRKICKWQEVKGSPVWWFPFSL